MFLRLVLQLEVRLEALCLLWESVGARLCLEVWNSGMLFVYGCLQLSLPRVSSELLLCKFTPQLLYPLLLVFIDQTSDFSFYIWINPYISTGLRSWLSTRLRLFAVRQLLIPLKIVLADVVICPFSILLGVVRSSRLHHMRSHSTQRRRPKLLLSQLMMDVWRQHLAQRRANSMCRLGSSS